ncbi:MAG: hypothetical protein D6741_03810, partial [Planctomycetota bacterium]
AERLQMLLHELGHYLGAVHVRDADSLMQPVLNERRARSKEFHLGFDPLNTLLLNLLVDEIVQQQGRPERLTAATANRVFAILDVIDALGPKDDSSARLRGIVTALAVPPAPPEVSHAEPQEPQSGASEETDPEMPRQEQIATRESPGAAAETAGEETSPPKGRPSGSEPTLGQTAPQGPSVAEKPTEDGTERISVGHANEPVIPPKPGIAASAGAVVRTVVEQARKTREAAQTSGDRLEGDAWAEYLVRETAGAVRRLPSDRREEAVKAFLLALGVLFDDSDVMRSQPVVGRIWRDIETDDQRATRIRYIGRVTIQDRHDWAQHFAVSAALTAV